MGEGGVLLGQTLQSYLGVSIGFLSRLMIPTERVRQGDEHPRLVPDFYRVITNCCL